VNLHSFCKTVLVGSILIQLITPTFSTAQESHPLNGVVNVGAVRQDNWRNSAP
jgi:hypothetical protein